MSDDLLDAARQALACLELANGNWLCADHRKFWEIVHANLIEFLRAFVEQDKRIKELEAVRKVLWAEFASHDAEHVRGCIISLRERIKELEAKTAPAPTPRTYEQAVEQCLDVLSDVARNNPRFREAMLIAAAALSALLPAKEANGE